VNQDFEDLSVLATELKRRGMSPGYFKAQRRRGMSAQEIFAAWPERRLSNRVGSRRFRRRLVVGTYAGWLLIAAIVKVMTLTDPKWSTSAIPVFSVLLVANSIISLVFLSRRTYINAPELADEELDERLVQIRNHAFRRAYQFVVPLALAGWLVSMVVMQVQSGAQGWTNAFLIYSGVAMLATTLPTAIIAWREPDPPEPEPLPA
jgi:hypothetical protein